MNLPVLVCINGMKGIVYKRKSKYSVCMYVCMYVCMPEGAEALEQHDLATFPKKQKHRDCAMRKAP